MNLSKLLLFASLAIIACFTLAKTSFAHVEVIPSQIEVSKFQSFTVGVPVEGDLGTVSVRLIVPEGLSSVTPNVKPGWSVETVKKGEGESAVVSEIIWSGGYIPVGQRDEFQFRAKAPSKEATVKWLAYQTLEDGSIIEWTKEPNSKSGEGDNHYSTSQVIKATAAPEKKDDLASKVPVSSNNLALVLSIIAVALASFATITSRKRN